MKLLVVGDPHVRVEDIQEATALVELISRTAARPDVDAVVLMGDLFHTHSVVHVEVLHFWSRAIERLAALRPVIVIRGNHDGPHDAKPGIHALVVLERYCRVVDSPVEVTVVPGGPRILFVPYCRDPDEFAAACGLYPETQTVYCHQEFDGAQFEGGFYSRDGADPHSIPQRQVVSGHIHASQEFDKVWYVGAPRWMTVADANVRRAIWVVEHDRDGAILSREPITTAGTCREIVALREQEGGEQQPTTVVASDLVDLRVDLHGSAGWLRERQQYWRECGAKVRTFCTDGPAVRVRESDGIGRACARYVDQYAPRHGAQKGDLLALAKERLPEFFAEEVES